MDEQKGGERNANTVEMSRGWWFVAIGWVETQQFTGL